MINTRQFFSVLVLIGFGCVGANAQVQKVAPVTFSPTDTVFYDTLIVTATSETPGAQVFLQSVFYLHGVKTDSSGWFAYPSPRIWAGGMDGTRIKITAIAKKDGMADSDTTRIQYIGKTRPTFLKAPNQFSKTSLKTYFSLLGRAVTASHQADFTIKFAR